MTIPVAPPDSWFDDPRLPGPMPLTVTREGRVLGHVAAWSASHVGLPGRVNPPRSSSCYRYYLSGQVETASGRMISTGRITLGTGHADLVSGVAAAADHYDNTGSAVADVACGEDAHGIWFAGALRPDVTPARVRTLRASSLSGDWRPIGQRGGLELVGVLAVNVAGFPTPRQAAVTASGRSGALVAAGVVPQRSGPAARPGAALLASIDFADLFARVDAEARARQGAALLASIDAGRAGRRGTGGSR